MYSLSFDETYQMMRRKLVGIVPEIELRYKAEIAHEILKLKAEKDAVILGHNYMEPALFHSIPDHTGDSLELCRKAAHSEKNIIVFCGVRFMAETAKILNPDKTVLLPARRAGCSLADSITGDDIRQLRARFPGVPVVSYINTYAEVKAESDICCTSGNAAKIIASLKSDRVIFVPDEFLARNVADETGKQIICLSRNRPRMRNGRWNEPEVIAWDGRCEVHDKFTVRDIEAVRRQFSDVIVLAHPECRPEVVQAADYSGSTSAMARFVAESPNRRYLLLTECSMADNIAAENPEKEMLRVCSVRCPHMNEITLEDTLAALRDHRYVIEVPEYISNRARRAVERMLELS